MAARTEAYVDTGALIAFADAVGLHVMAVHRVRTCWSTDRHMALTGIPLVIHEH